MTTAPLGKMPPPRKQVRDILKRENQLEGKYAKLASDSVIREGILRGRYLRSGAALLVFSDNPGKKTVIFLLPPAD